MAKLCILVVDGAHEVNTCTFNKFTVNFFTLTQPAAGYVWIGSGKKNYYFRLFMTPKKV